MFAIVISKRKLSEIIVKALFRTLTKQQEIIEELQVENKAKDEVIETLHDVLADTSMEIAKISNELQETSELMETNELTNQAFLAVIRSKLRNGASREDVCNKITEFLHV